ncbi:SAM-dependent DNA methyltransferase [Aurantimicrobium minutum]|uniref:SAM-dependent DNA methyltransferase n=1 Tax=Aurantimicrobium minutum TaxID=708131 RepID=UPI002475EEE7|nr:SAM-dependent DNA methyltransferase [Aurantimicrobium minutum]MDH6536539.1 SAM-dependent methyltransferase [Aurantimicrobium minutum]
MSMKGEFMSEGTHAPLSIDISSRLDEQIKSRERVRDLAEVFTHEREVNDMLDLVPDMFIDIDSRFLEPACGTGNFLVEILGRKISLISESIHGGSPLWYEFALLRCIASIYAVDISAENVAESRNRLLVMLDAAHALHGEPMSEGFLRAANEILETNVVLGDSLSAATEIVFVEYEALEGEKFKRTPSHLEEPEIDLFYLPPEQLETVHFSMLGKD